MNELKNSLFDLLARRADREARLLRVACARNDELNCKCEATLNWPVVNYIPIPNWFRRYCSKQVEENTCRIQKYVAGLNRQRGVGDLVSPNGQTDRIGPTIRPQRNDMRPVDYRKERAAIKARWKACQREECQDWGYRNGCLARQRAGTCAALKRSSYRPDTASVPGHRSKTGRRTGEGKNRVG